MKHHRWKFSATMHRTCKIYRFRHRCAVATWRLSIIKTRVRTTLKWRRTIRSCTGGPRYLMIWPRRPSPPPGRSPRSKWRGQKWAQSLSLLWTRWRIRSSVSRAPTRTSPVPCPRASIPIRRRHSPAPDSTMTLRILARTHRSMVSVGRFTTIHTFRTGSRTRWAARTCRS